MAARVPMWKVVTRDAAGQRHDIFQADASLVDAVAAVAMTLPLGTRITAAFLAAAPEHPSTD